jgi:hypothetical protein
MLIYCFDPKLLDSDLQNDFLGCHSKGKITAQHADLNPRSFTNDDAPGTSSDSLSSFCPCVSYINSNSIQKHPSSTMQTDHFDPPEIASKDTRHAAPKSKHIINRFRSFGYHDSSRRSWTTLFSHLQDHAGLDEPMKSNRSLVILCGWTRKTRARSDGQTIDQLPPVKLRCLLFFFETSSP